MAASSQPYQSLYRRYRPQRFGEVRGQDHLTRALHNAVRDGQVAHAYLFSGPRGTGKTSTARILAKALNCTDLRDGEPCCECTSCLEVQKGASLDVHELDAASNNGVDAMRELVARAALGTPGRWKVYIVDEVHMLSTAASNALLKTLEEPPGHVVFVLATTDPQKVLPTIRSRTQHYEFRLLPGEVLAELLRTVVADAGLTVTPAALEVAARRAGGSARDALSVLDQAAAAGVIDDKGPITDGLVEALCAHDAGRALVAVAEGCTAGLDARRLASDLLGQLREVFLMLTAEGLVTGSEDEKNRWRDQARRLGPAGVVRCMEGLGQALAEMKEALEPRVCLEVSLVRLAAPDLDVSPAALLERIERLERRMDLQPAPAPLSPTSALAPPSSDSDRPASAPAPPTSSQGSVGVRTPSRSGARSTPGPTPPARLTPPPSPVPRSSSPGSPVPRGERRRAPATSPSPQPPSASGSSIPTRDELTKAWGDVVLGQLPSRARVRFAVGRFAAVDDGVALYALPNRPHRDRCEEVRPEVEAALASYFGVPVPLRLVVDSYEDSPGEPEPADAESFDPSDLVEAPSAVTSPEDRLKQAFPGAEEVEG